MATSKDTSLRSLFKGTAGESRITSIFNSWHWVTAKPSPDLGADLMVDLSHLDGFARTSFAVQIKTSDGRRNTIKLESATANRLRNQMLPVFVFYFNRTENLIRWLNVDALLRLKESHTAKGDVYIKVARMNSFHPEAQPPQLLTHAILQACKQSALKSFKSPSDYSMAFRRSMAEIDPNLDVRPTLNGDSHGLAFYIVNPEARIEFLVQAKGKNNVQAIRDAMNWGSEAKVDDGRVRLYGSPVFKHLEIEEGTGSFVMGPTSAWEGKALLEFVELPGAGAIFVDCRLSHGSLGGEIRFTDGSKTLTLILHLHLDGELDATFNVNFKALTSLRIRELHRLEPTETILRAMLTPGEMRFTLIDHPLVRRATTLNCVSAANADAFAIHDDMVGLVALGTIWERLGGDWGDRILGSPMISELPGWREAAKLVSGEKITKSVTSAILAFDETTLRKLENSSTGNFVIQSEWGVNHDGLKVCAFPVMHEFVNFKYSVDTSRGQNELCLSANGADSSYHVALDPDPPGRFRPIPPGIAG